MDTKIISVVGEKGGIGKTTLNIILASDLFYAKGKKIVLLDADNPQYSIYKKGIGNWKCWTMKKKNVWNSIRLNR